MALKLEAADIQRARPWMDSVLHLVLCFRPQNIPPEIERLVYWYNVPLTACLFSGVIIFSLLASCYSIITILAWLGLILLIGGAALRLSKNCQEDKTTTCRFHQLMEFNFHIPPEKVQLWAGKAVQQLNIMLCELRNLFQISDFFKSLKFGGMLLSLTYMGSYMNGLSLFLIVFMYIFLVPKLYEMNKSMVDTILAFGIIKVLKACDNLNWFNNQAAEADLAAMDEQLKHIDDELDKDK